MSNCQKFRNGAFLIQLQSLNLIVTVNNNLNQNFNANSIRVQILPSSQPIGFFLDYVNTDIITNNSHGILNNSQINKFPNIVREIATFSTQIGLDINISIRGVILDPKIININLLQTDNGKISQVVATSNNSNIKAELLINYSYLKVNNLDKWTITGCQLILSEHFI